MKLKEQLQLQVLVYLQSAFNSNRTISIILGNHHCIEPTQQMKNNYYVSHSSQYLFVLDNDHCLWAV